MKKMKAILFAVAFLAIGVTQTVNAQDKAAEEKKAEMKKEMKKKKVNYDVDRMASYLEKIATSRKELKLKREELAEAVKSGSISEDDAKAKTKELDVKEERLNAMQAKADKKMSTKPTSSKDRGKVMMKQKAKEKSKN